MTSQLTFHEVVATGRLAHWTDPEEGHILCYQPGARCCLWLCGEGSEDPRLAWRPYSGHPPAVGWRHTGQPCDCPFCS